jgi:hypothetical protein
LETLGPVDYLIDTPDRKKAQRVCHVNLLKPYLRREEKWFPRSDVGSSTQLLPVCVTLGNHGQDFGNSIPALHDLKQAENIDTKLKHLTASQRHDLRSLLNSFGDVFKDTPGKTTLITHRIKLREGSKPVSCAPYRLNSVRQEIQEKFKFRIEAVKVCTDHSPLQFLERMAPHNAKLLSWSFELQQYNLQIVHRPGKDNLFPDILSRPSA